VNAEVWESLPEVGVDFIIKAICWVNKNLCKPQALFVRTGEQGSVIEAASN